METKSSLRRITRSLVYVVLAFVVLRMATGQEPPQVLASPQNDRTVVRKPWLIEPVKVVAAKNKKKERIDIDKTFVDDDDWLDGFTITVINNSDKIVTAVTVDMIFRREPGDPRSPVAEQLHFGPSPMRPEYNLRDPSKVINVGETADLELAFYNYTTLKDILERKGYSNSIKRVELVIKEVGFEDGSVLYSGALYLQDPKHPGDPTKKILAGRKPPGVQRHHARTLLDRKNVRSEAFLLKASLRLSDTVQPAECFERDPNPVLLLCDQDGYCATVADTVDPFTVGAWDTEFLDRRCYTYEPSMYPFFLIAALPRMFRASQTAKFRAASNTTPVLWQATVVPGSTVMEEFVNHQVARLKLVLVNVLKGLARRHLF